ncbi:signal peptidase I [Kitasatospora sp. GAS204A]|uniref:signal peptidase I n=1 Tax=unclassified Kitasatospora TaxID=2633591 RepID=UPI002476E7F7|nr:signal peptidase I [Kitasatospora sp. GAS204B]MDH6122119.1 signal peptidase I [Kitasatospora sp. GAS204B]
MSRLAEETPGPAGSAAASTGPARPARRRPEIGAVLQGVALVLGLGLLLGGFGMIALDYRPYAVPTSSMAPTIAAGDTVLARTVDGNRIGRGDIVVFHDPTWGNATMVKRVVGVGGDTVACCDAQHRFTVNGVPLDESYLAPGGPPSAAFSAKVPAGRLFLLGDNRTGSLDSRTHLDDLAGTVATSQVQARVEATVWPFGHSGLWGRTVAFDALGGPTASRPGPLVPLAWAMAAGAVIIVLTSLTGPVATLVRRIRGAGRS